MQLDIMQSSPVPCYLASVRSDRLPQQEWKVKGKMGQ